MGELRSHVSPPGWAPAASIVPAVRRFAQENQGLLLEAERRGIHNELATLEREIENNRANPR